MYPKACFTLAREGFILRAVGFYEGTIIRLQEDWKRLKSELEKLALFVSVVVDVVVFVVCFLLLVSYCLCCHLLLTTFCKHTHAQPLHSQQHMKLCLRALKKDFAWLVHQLIQVCFVSPKEEDSSGVKSKNPLDDFISVVSDIASERRCSVCVCVRVCVCCGHDNLVWQLVGDMATEWRAERAKQQLTRGCLS